MYRLAGLLFRDKPCPCPWGWSLHGSMTPVPFGSLHHGPGKMRAFCHSVQLQISSIPGISLLTPLGHFPIQAVDLRLSWQRSSHAHWGLVFLLQSLCRSPPELMQKAWADWGTSFTLAVFPDRPHSLPSPLSAHGPPWLLCSLGPGSWPHAWLTKPAQALPAAA